MASLYQAASRGSIVLVGTDPARACRDDFLTELQRLAAAAREGQAKAASDQPIRGAIPEENDGTAELQTELGVGRASTTLAWPMAPGQGFFEPPVTLALPPVKWKAKYVEIALLNPR
jgi:hypothetical protein